MGATADKSPWLNVTPKIAAKVSASIVLMTIGLYLLTTGRRDANMSRIALGAILCLGSLFVF